MPDGTCMQVLGRFALWHDGVPVPVGAGGSRLLAFLALQRGAPVHRRDLAEMLWDSGNGTQASSNLRAALCRLPRPAGKAGLVRSHGPHLSLAADVTVDLTTADGRITDGTADATCTRLLSDDLLPHWDDEWLTIERERYRQLRLHALEDLSADLREQGRSAEALAAALAAMAAEPLRETPHRRVIEVHLAEGNLVEAVRAYRALVRLLRTELAVMPSPDLRDMVTRALRQDACG
jgi:DNA-binding SARP family transcriptional activator